MRNLPVKPFLSSMSLLVIAGMALAQAQSDSAKTAPAASTTTPAKGSSPLAKSENPKPSELEQMLAEALVNNPDIHVAEAKLREAEAELNRVRFQVLQKVSTLHHSLEPQKLAVKAAEASLQHFRQLQLNGQIPTGEVQRVESLLGQEKAKLATLEAELPSLLGRPPQSASLEKKGTEAGGTAAKDGFMHRYWETAPRSSVSFRTRGSGEACALCHDATAWTGNHKADWFEAAHGFPARWSGVAHQFLGQPAQGAMADKIRKALDTLVTVDIKDKRLSEALKVFEEKASGIPFHNAISGSTLVETEVAIHLKQVPLGAALQALEDSFSDGAQIHSEAGGLRLAVREYGILVTSQARLPRGATLLYDFWKGHTGQEKVKGNAAPDNAAEKTPPPEDVEGVIKATDPQSGMVTISIGSDAGLRKGYTLEVYRLKPEPKYLGSIRILSVRPTEAVAKPTRDSAVKLEVGDRVTSSIRQR